MALFKSKKEKVGDPCNGVTPNEKQLRVFKDKSSENFIVCQKQPKDKQYSIRAVIKPDNPAHKDIMGAWNKSKK